MKLVLCEVADASAHGVASFSPFCVKVQRALHLAGLPYTRRHGAMPSSHRALNPTGQVPVLLVDDQPITDSTAILAWIVDQGGLDASPEGWLYEELADAAINGLLVASRWADPENWPRTEAAFFGDMPWLLRQVIPGRLRAGVIRALIARDVWRAGPAAFAVRVERTLDHLDARAPTTGFWCGPRPGVADVALFGQLASLRLPLTPAQADAIRRRPRLNAWIDRVDLATAAPASGS